MRGKSKFQTVLNNGNLRSNYMLRENRSIILIRDGKNDSQQSALQDTTEDHSQSMQNLHASSLSGHAQLTQRNAFALAHSGVSQQQPPPVQLASLTPGQLSVQASYDLVGNFSESQLREQQRYAKVVNDYTEGEFLRNQIKRQNNIRLRNFFKDFGAQIKKITGERGIINNNMLRRFANEYQLDSPRALLRRKVSPERSSAIKQYEQFVRRAHQLKEDQYQQRRQSKDNLLVGFQQQTLTQQSSSKRRLTTQDTEDLTERTETEQKRLPSLRATPKSHSLQLPTNFMHRFKQAKADRQATEQLTP